MSTVGSFRPPAPSPPAAGGACTSAASAVPASAVPASAASAASTASFTLALDSSSSSSANESTARFRFLARLSMRFVAVVGPRPAALPDPSSPAVCALRNSSALTRPYRPLVGASACEDCWNRASMLRTLRCASLAIFALRFSKALCARSLSWLSFSARPPAATRSTDAASDTSREKPRCILFVGGRAPPRSRLGRRRGVVARRWPPRQRESWKALGGSQSSSPLSATDDAPGLLRPSPLLAPRSLGHVPYFRL